MSDGDGAKSDSWLNSVRSVADGASLHYVGYVIVTGFGFLLELLLTRTLGAGLYGIYTFGNRIISAVLMFVNFGSDVSITKYLSEYHEDRARQNQILLLSYVTSFIISIAVSIALFIGAPLINSITVDERGFTYALRLFSVVLPFEALTRIAANSFRGLEMPAHKTTIMIIRPSVRLMAIGGAVLLGYSLLGIVAAYVIAGVMLCLFAVSFALRRTHLIPEWREGLSGAEIREFYNFSAPMTFSRAASLLYTRVDIFMVAFLLSSSDIGIYNIAVLLGTIVALPLMGFNQLFPPVASRLYSDNDRETLESVYITVTRWSISTSIIVAVPLVLFRAEILAIFGEEFVAGTGVVVLIVLGQLINSAAGPANDLLTMTDHQYLVLVNHWVFGILNLVLNYFLIIEFGIAGAALATASVLAALNVVRVIEVWYFESLWGYSLSLWKPLIASIGAAISMVVIQWTIDGLALVVVGGVLGVAVYGALLYLFGIEDADRELANKYLEILS